MPEDGRGRKGVVVDDLKLVRPVGQVIALLGVNLILKQRYRDHIMTGTKVDLRTIPAFRLNQSQYWCPADIGGADHTLPANARSTISLEKGASMNTRIDVSKLGWDRGISSIWPAQNLFSLVPPGRYSLRLDFEVVEGGGPEWIRSNEVEVAIRE